MKKRIKYMILVIFVILTNPKVVNAYSAKTVTTSSENSVPQISQQHIIMLIIFLIIGTILILFVSKVLNSTKELSTKKGKHSNGLTDREIKKIDANLNIDILKEQTFTLYKKIETAITKQSIKSIKDIAVEELYQEQDKIIKLLKENKQKIVATNIKLENFKVLSIDKKDNKKNILTHLHVSQYDYTIDKNKTVIRGTDESVYQIEYQIMLENNYNNQFKIKKINCIGKWIKND